jgi:predicted nucleotidyltransferase
MKTSSEILSKLKENKRFLQELGVKRVGVFGSAVGKGLSEMSDIDIYVEFDLKRLTLDGYIKLTEFLEKLFGRKVDILTKEGLRNIRVPHIKKQIKNSIVYA